MSKYGWYVYYISYASENGWGRFRYTSGKKIKRFNQIKNIEEYISSVTGEKNVVVLNFIRVRE
jgi:hypothetical protein